MFLVEIAGFMSSLRNCFPFSLCCGQETTPNLEEEQGQTIRVGAGVEPRSPSAGRVFKSDRITNLEIQVKALEDEVKRVAELALKNSSGLQKTATASKTVAHDTAVLAAAVRDLNEMVNKLAHSVKHLSHEHLPQEHHQRGAA